MKTKIVPVIIGALETIKKGLDQNLQLLLSAVQLQKTTLMSTAHVVHKVKVKFSNNRPVQAQRVLGS